MTQRPRLNWRRLGPAIPDSTSITDILISVKNLIIDSSSYWQLVESSGTGSNSLIVRPTGQLSSSMQVILAGAVSQDDAYRTPDTNASNATRLQMAFTPISGTFNSGSYDSSTPFGNIRFSKYWHVSTTTSTSASFILESEESIFFGFKDTSQQILGGLVGAILEPYDETTGEQNGRIFGMITAGPTAIPAGFWNQATFLEHVHVLSSPHAGVFTVSGSVANASTGSNTHDWTFIKKDIGAPGAGVSEFSTWGASPTGASIIGIPIPYSTQANSVTALRAIGRSRGFFFSQDAEALTTLMTGSAQGAIRIGGATNVVDDAVMFGPMSGSGIP